MPIGVLRMTSELQETPLNNMLTMWNDEAQLRTIKSIYAKDATELEFKTFVEMGIATGLNPFLREIWLVKYDRNAAAQIFIGRDGYRKTINRNANYQGHHVDAVYSNDDFCFDLTRGEVKHTYNLKDRGKLLGAYCVVHMRNVPRPYYLFVELAEYDLNHSQWKTKKATMIKKVAECQALRMADSCAFGGTYGEDEGVQNARQESNAGKLNARLGLAPSENKTFEGEIINDETGEVTAPENIPAAENADCEKITLEHVKYVMEMAGTVKDLMEAVDMAKTLPEEERKTVRRLYKEKEREING